MEQSHMEQLVDEKDIQFYHEPNAEVSLFWLHTDAVSASEEHISSLMEQSRYEKYCRYRFKKDKDLLLAGEILLSYGIKKVSDGSIPFLPKRSYGEYGKPYFTGETADYRFNLSHSGEYAVCAFSKHEVGVDIQKIGEYRTAVAGRFFTEKEKKFLDSRPQKKQAEEFYRLWVLKESYVKAVGEGLHMSLDSFEFEETKENCYLVKNPIETQNDKYVACLVDKIPSYRLAVCVRK